MTCHPDNERTATNRKGDTSHDQHRPASRWHCDRRDGHLRHRRDRSGADHHADESERSPERPDQAPTAATRPRLVSLSSTRFGYVRNSGSISSTRTSPTRRPITATTSSSALKHATTSCRSVTTRSSTSSTRSTLDVASEPNACRAGGRSSKGWPPARARRSTPRRPRYRAPPDPVGGAAQVAVEHATVHLQPKCTHP